MEKKLLKEFLLKKTKKVTMTLQQQEILTEEEIKQNSIKYYTNNNFSEFEKDYVTLKYIKKILNQYKIKHKINLRLTLNYFVLLGNTFEKTYLLRLLFSKINEEHYSLLKTFLVFLNFCSTYDNVELFNCKIILDINKIEIDEELFEMLNKL